MISIRQGDVDRTVSFDCGFCSVSKSEELLQIGFTGLANYKDEALLELVKLFDARPNQDGELVISLSASDNGGKHSPCMINIDLDKFGKILQIEIV